MASIKDLAELSGFSVATVSRYINHSGSVSKDAAKAINNAITQLGYKPNYIARSLVIQKTNVLGILVPSLSLSFLASYVEGLEKAAAELGYTIILCNSHEDAKIEERSLHMLQTRRVDGIIATPVSADASLFREIAEDIPLVIALRNVDGLDVSTIMNDDYAGAYKVVEYLIKKGHRDIAFINGPKHLSTGALRWNGVSQAMQNAGIPIEDDWVTFCPYYTINDGYEAAKSILAQKKRPTAFFAANQILCIGLMKALDEYHLRIPEDVSVVSFDGFEDCFAEPLVKPKITSNFNPVFNLGELAAELLIEEIKIFSRKQQNKINYSTTRHLSIKMEFREQESVKDLTKG